MINKKISVGNFVISKHFAFFIFLYPDLVFFISLVFFGSDDLGAASGANRFGRNQETSWQWQRVVIATKRHVL